MKNRWKVFFILKLSFLSDSEVEQSKYLFTVSFRCPSVCYLTCVCNLGHKTDSYVLRGYLLVKTSRVRQVTSRFHRKYLSVEEPETEAQICKTHLTIRTQPNAPGAQRVASNLINCICFQS